MKFFNLPAFIISLALGLFISYAFHSNYEEIHVYPNLNNINDILYKDKANQCFKFKANKIQCPKTAEQIKQIPIQ